MNLTGRMSFTLVSFSPKVGHSLWRPAPLLTATRTEKTLSCFLLYGATEGGLQVEKRGSEYSAFTVNRGLPQNYYTKKVKERKKERN